MLCGGVLGDVIVMQQGGGVGVEGALVDRDGYPRSDIDVYAVRTARNKIICECCKVVTIVRVCPNFNMEL